MTPEPTIPQRLIAGRYALLGEIGRGGMGIVWIAEDRMIGRRVAIKELHLPAGVPDDERTVLEERVLREARAAGRLNDPGVVTVYDVVRESGNTYIVMELIEAPTLSAIVREQGALPPDAVARLAEQLLSALEAAHGAGVVHRDVKPSNIMVLANGRVKLTDFGIAQSTDDPRLTSSGVLVGSPTYIAPERIKGADADAKSDLWALAAVLFYAVEGHSPFERSSTAATMHAIVSEVPFLTRCQGPLASAIMGLLNQVPAARPSAEQVRGLLAQHTPPAGSPPGGFASASPAGTAGTRPGGFASASPAGLAGTLPAGPSHIPPPGFATTSPMRPGHGATPDPYRPTTVNTAPNREHRSPMRAVLLVVIVALVSGGLFVGGFFTHRAVQPEADDGRPANIDPTITYGDGGTLPELSWGSYPGGACLNGRLAQGQRITASAQVECTDPHDLEFYHSEVQLRAPEDYEHFPDASYPGTDQLTAFTEPLCTLIFRSALIVGDKEAVNYRAIVPTRHGWADNRSVICVLYRADGDQLTESYIASE